MKWVTQTPGPTQVGAGAQVCAGAHRAVDGSGGVSDGLGAASLALVGPRAGICGPGDDRVFAVAPGIPSSQSAEAIATAGAELPGQSRRSAAGMGGACCMETYAETWRATKAGAEIDSIR